MKIIVNTSIIRFGGAVQVALSLINEFKNFNDNEYHIFVGSGVKPSINEDNFPSNFFFYYFDFGPVNLITIRKISRKLKLVESNIRPDFIITSSGPSYWKSKAPQLMGYNLPLHIYTESPYLKTIKLKKKIRFFFKRKFHFWFFKRDVAAYFVQTDDVNDRVRKRLKNDNVHTISNTHSGYYNNPKVYPNKLPKRKNGEKRLLILSSYYPHKNIEILKQLLPELSKRGLNNIHFILTIKEEKFFQIFTEEERKNIYNIGTVPPEECPSLYRECDILFQPSLAECFSASYPEAMAMKIPIITTNLSFAHDICNNAALYYQAMDYLSAADKIENLLKDKALKNKLIENGTKRLSAFNNSRERAEKVLNICETHLKARGLDKV